MRNEKFVRQGKDARVDAPSAPIPVKPRPSGVQTAPLSSSSPSPELPEKLPKPSPPTSPHISLLPFKRNPLLGTFRHAPVTALTAQCPTPLRPRGLLDLLETPSQQASSAPTVLSRFSPRLQRSGDAVARVGVSALSLPAKTGGKELVTAVDEYRRMEVWAFEVGRVMQQRERDC